MNLTEQLTQAQVKNALAKAKSGKVLNRREEQLIRDFEANRAPELTLEVVAEHFGMSRAGVLRWKRTMAQAGLPWTSLDQIQAWRESQEKKIKPNDINASRKAKLEREIERLDLMIAKEKGEMISRASVREACVRIGAALAASLASMCNDLPGLMAGKSEVEIRDAVVPRVAAMQEQFNEATLRITE
jgi:hypothetical protein